MNKLSNRDHIDTNAVNVDPIVTDTTPWFWVEANNQKVNQMWFRFLGAWAERPAKPRRWDMIYNTKTRKIEIYVSEFYRWWTVPTVSNAYIAQPWDYADVAWVLWYTETGAWTPLMPAPSDRERTNTISFWAEQQSYFLRNYAIIDELIPTWVYTQIWWLSLDYVTSTLPDSRGIKTWIIPYTWYYLLLWNVSWLQKQGETKTELRLMKGVQQIAYDMHEIPAMAFITTWTDSVGWPITATTTSTSSALDYVSQKVVRYGKLEEWDIISVEVRHNAWSDLTATPWTTFPTSTQYQTWFSIIAQ